RELGPQLGMGAAFEANLVAAAYLHDVGYAPDVSQTGFHQLDGAVWCAHRGYSDELVTAVLTHSGAPEEAALDPRVRDVYASLPPIEPSLLADALTFCDLRTSPTGERITANERLREIAARYGAEHIVTRSQPAAEPRMRAARMRVMARIAQVRGTLPWVFVDVDNTLVGPGEMPRERTARTIREYVAAGGRVSLATGKHVEAIRLLQDALGLPGPHVSGNGALVVDGDDVRALYHLDAAHLALTEVLRRMEVAYIVYVRAELLSDSPHLTDEKIWRLTRYYESAPRRVERVVPEDEPFKILTYVPHGDPRESEVRALAASGGVACVRTAPDFLEMLGNEDGKAHGMAWILENANWPGFHTIAIGDGENDLTMMRRAGLAFAVANAEVAVRDAADRVFASCLDEGVADALDELRRPCEGREP
ncbi:MAG: Cof-type HAD-IIB family hydrolase, partial [Deltaproteobacteria bacterium]|nr:Cof-type HAD-IIB family hydrolase [Deltaproteobacteria bacterium]